MNYELIMLKNALRAKRLAQNVAQEITVLAMRSYDTRGYRDGTLGQVQKLHRLCQRAEMLNGFCAIVESALRLLPKGVRTLLIQVYIKGRTRQDIALRCRTSLSSVYRKLRCARLRFREALEAVGCTEEFFIELYRPNARRTDGLGVPLKTVPLPRMEFAD